MLDAINNLRGEMIVVIDKYVFLMGNFYGTLTVFTQQLNFALVQNTHNIYSYFFFALYNKLTWNIFMNFYPCPHPGKFIQSPSFD